MRERTWIGAGVVSFAAVALFPVWYDALAGKAPPPEVVLPTSQRACIEPTAWMIANHPKLLNDWRNAVVREGRTRFVSSSGQSYSASFTGTCMSCHPNRATFCDRCHTYADVNPTCWSCHVEPQRS